MDFKDLKQENKQRKLKIKYLKQLKEDVNVKLILTDPFKDEEKYYELLQSLRDIESNIFSLKRNKRNSKFYEWIPNVGLNRSQRRA